MSEVRLSDDAKDLFDRGYLAMDKQDFHEACECLTRAINLRPDVAAGYRARAKAYLALARRGEAIQDLERAIRLKPNDPHAYAERAEVFFRQKAYDEAIADCDKVLTLDPGWISLRGLRGECYAASGRTDLALQDYSAALAGDPEHAVSYLLARATLHLDCEHFSECIEDCTIAVTLNEECAPAFRIRGLANRSQGELHEAEADFTQSLNLEPTAVLTLLARAAVRSDQQRFSAAIEDCDQVLRLDPESAQAFYLRGVCRQNLQDLEGSLADLNQAITLAPHVQLPYSTRANLYCQRGEYRQAIQEYLAILKRSSRDAAVMNQLGWIWATAADPAIRDAERAKTCATRACELTDWQNAEYLDTLAAAFAANTEFEEAIKWQTEALARMQSQNPLDYQERLALYQKNLPFRVQEQ